MVVSDGVAPRRKTAVGAEEPVVAGIELDLIAFPDNLPLHRRVEWSCERLDHFSTNRIEEELMVQGGEVAVVAAFEAVDGLVALETAVVVVGPPITVVAIKGRGNVGQGWA